MVASGARSPDVGSGAYIRGCRMRPAERPGERAMTMSTPARIDSAREAASMRNLTPATDIADRHERSEVDADLSASCMRRDAMCRERWRLEFEPSLPSGEMGGDGAFAVTATSSIWRWLTTSSAQRGVSHSPPATARTDQMYPTNGDASTVLGRANVVTFSTDASSAEDAGQRRQEAALVLLSGGRIDRLPWAGRSTATRAWKPSIRLWPTARRRDAVPRDGARELGRA